VGAIYSVFVYLVFPIVVGDKYDEALQFVIVLILANTFQSLYYTVSNYILFEGKTMVLSTMTILIGLLYAITGWYTVSSHGLSILPYVLASISVAYFFLIWIISNRINPKPWFNFNKLLPEAQKFFPNLSTYSK
jgi:O-antigen/teichoic acid export membrane protein